MSGPTCRALAAVVLAAGCAVPAPAGEPKVPTRSGEPKAPARADEPKLASPLESSLQEYARRLKAADAGALAEMYASDGELLQPGLGPIRGPQAIRAFLASFGDVHVESAVMLAESTQLLGRDAVQWGTFEQRVSVPGRAASVARGRFVAQWTKQRDGRWLLRRLLTQPFP